jgi:hypothetical protein
LTHLWKSSLRKTSTITSYYDGYQGIQVSKSKI